MNHSQHSPRKSSLSAVSYVSQRIRQSIKKITDSVRGRVAAAIVGGTLAVVQPQVSAQSSLPARPEAVLFHDQSKSGIPQHQSPAARPELRPANATASIKSQPVAKAKPRKGGFVLPDLTELSPKERYRAYRDLFQKKTARLVAKYGVNFHIAAANDSIFDIESQRNWNADNKKLQAQINKRAGYQKVKDGKVAFGGFQITRETRFGLWKNYYASQEKLPSDEEFLNPDVQKAYMAALMSENIERCLKVDGVVEAIQGGIYQLSDFVHAMHLHGPSAVQKLLSDRAESAKKTTRDWLNTTLGDYIAKGKSRYQDYLYAANDANYVNVAAKPAKATKTTIATKAPVPAPTPVSIPEPIVVAKAPEPSFSIAEIIPEPIVVASIPEDIPMPAPREELPVPISAIAPAEPVRALPPESVRVRHVRVGPKPALYTKPPKPLEAAEPMHEAGVHHASFDVDFDLEPRSSNVKPLPIVSELQKREKQIRGMLIAEMGKNRRLLLSEHTKAVVEKKPATAMILVNRIDSLERRAQDIAGTDSLPKFYQTLATQLQNEISVHKPGSKESEFAKSTLEDVRAEYGFALTTAKKLTAPKIQVARTTPAERTAAILDTASLAYKSNNRYSDVANDEVYLKRA